WFSSFLALSFLWLSMGSLLVLVWYLRRQQSIQNLLKGSVRPESAECRHRCLAGFIGIPDCHDKRGCAAGAGLYRFLEALADLSGIPIAVEALLEFRHVQVQGPGVCSQFGYAQSLLVLEQKIVHFPVRPLFARTKSRFSRLESCRMNGFNRSVFKEIADLARVHVVRDNFRQDLLRMPVALGTREVTDL